MSIFSAPPRICRALLPPDTHQRRKGDGIMDIEKLLDQLAHMDPYKVQILKDQLEEHNERKMIALIGRLVLSGMALLFWLLKG